MFQHACISSGQITQPKIDNLRALSDRLLVNWSILTYVSDYDYPCQVRYRKVCSYLNFYMFIFQAGLKKKNQKTDHNTSVELILHFVYSLLQKNNWF